MVEMTLTALLLVGGESRRMGTDKATLVVGREELWRRQLRLLCELKPDCLWASARVRPSWCPKEIEVILDEPLSRGPLSGLVSALSRLQSSHLLALAVDMPRMTVAHLRKLLALAQSGRGVVPVIDNRFEPLCAVYPTEAAAVAEGALRQGRLSLQDFVRTLSRRDWIESYDVPVEERELYLNLNEPMPR